jgi:predicted negative regulator of RcsB-dependent stress response
MDKKTEKLLKKPDAFQTFIFHAANWIKVQERTLILAILPISALILAGGGWQYYRYYQRDQLKHQLAEIEKIFSKEEKEAGKLRNKIREDVQKLESEKDAAKKAANKALIDAKNKEMENINADHKDSLAKYIAFFHAHEKDAEGWRAGLTAVSILTKAKNFEESSAILNKILQHSMGIEFYQVQVRLMYIGIMEDLKKYDEGLAEIEKLLPLASDEILPRVLLTKARFQMEAGKREEGVKTLDGIISSHSSSPEARQAIAIKAL